MHWHTNPDCSFWPGKVPSRVVLCSRCYQAGHSARARGRPAKLPKYENGFKPLSFGASEAQCPSTEEHSPEMLINKPSPEAGELEVLVPLCPAPVSNPPPEVVTVNNSIKRRRINIPAYQSQSKAGDNSSDIDLQASLPVKLLQQLVPSMHPKGCNMDGLLDMHLPSNVSFNEGAQSASVHAYSNSRLDGSNWNPCVLRFPSLSPNSKAANEETYNTV